MVYLFNKLKFISGFYLVLILIFSAAFNFLIYPYTQDSIITKLFTNSYYTIKSVRQPNGVYLDALLISGTEEKPASIAANGIGLISLCIADSMFKKTKDSVNWEYKSEALVDTTLVTFINFKKSGVTNSKGFFPRYFDKNTGFKYKDWTTEYSTIDNAIFAMGLIFCTNYFANNDSIVSHAHFLLDSIDFTAAIPNDTNDNGLYMVLDSNGNGIENQKTKPFNEYMIVAWLAKNVSSSNSGYNKSQNYWNKYYSNPKTSLIPKLNYWGYELICDGRFISNFIYQFAFYYCSYFKNNNDYMNYLKNARISDSLWWTKASPQIDSYKWDLGAGENPGGGYSANAIDNNPYLIVSPHIIVGFIPIYSKAKNDLISLYNQKLGLYKLPSDSSRKILFRYSHKNPSIGCSYIQLVDFSTMLYGLACLPEHLNYNFFNTYSEIKKTSSKLKKSKNILFDKINIKNSFYSPVNSEVDISFDVLELSFVSLKIFDFKGKQVSIILSQNLPKGKYIKKWNTTGLKCGQYFCKLQINNSVKTQKIILID
jgi:hypothetical protein